MSITPGDGDTGISKDSAIVVTFSEPMARDSAQAAFSCQQIDAVTFEWNDDETVMTVIPKQGLQYATGSDEDFDALIYGVTIAKSATDMAGNPLPEAASSAFSTLRQVDLTFTSGSAIDSSPTDGDGLKSSGTAAEGFYVGDWNDDVSSRGFVAFDISAMPAARAVTSASLRLYVEEISGTPFDVLGVMSVDHIYSATITSGTYDQTALHALGVIADTVMIDTWFEKDVTVAFVDDYEHRSARNDQTQYRLAFDVETDNDGGSDYIRFADATAPSDAEAPLSELLVSYMLP